MTTATTPPSSNKPVQTVSQEDCSSDSAPMTTATTPLSSNKPVLLSSGFSAQNKIPQADILISR